VRLFEIHDQKWFPQFLRDEFVDGLQMILDVTSTYQPSLPLVAAPLEVFDSGDSFRSFFDGLISCLRAYSPAELREMTRGLATSGYRWEIGEKSGGLLPVPVTYLVGCPRSASVESGD